MIVMLDNVNKLTGMNKTNERCSNGFSNSSDFSGVNNLAGVF